MSDVRERRIEELLAHTRWVEALARRLASDRTRAEDLAQSTLLVALDRGAASPGRDAASIVSPRAWLARVLRNLQREEHRREAQRRDVERRGARAERLPGADELYARADAERALVQAVLELEPEHGEILLLHHFEGVTLDDIARAEHVAPSTVSARLARAHAALREKLDRERGADWLAASLPFLLRPLESSSRTTNTILMSTAVKCAAAVVVLGLGLGIWLATRDTPRTELAHEATPARETLEAPQSGSSAVVPPAQPLERANIAESPPAASAPTSAPAPAAPGATPPAASTKPARLFGRVVNPKGDPAVGRVVNVLCMPRGPMHKVTTDKEGRFDERDLAPGKYHVSTMPEKDECAALGITSPYGGIVWISQVSVALVAGGEVELELGVAPRDPIRVHGRLVGGENTADALLQWAPQGEDGYNRARYTTTRDDGGYEILLGDRGRYRVSVSVRGASVRHDETLDVPSGAEWAHDIVLPKGAVRVRVVERGGAPLDGANVDLVPRAGVAPIPYMSASGTSHKTDEEGRTGFRPLEPGVWTVYAYVTRVASKPPLAAGALVVSIGGGAQPDEQLIELEPGVELTGRVVAEDGGAVYYTNVFAFDERGEPQNPLSGATTDKQGAFRLPGLRAGRYTLIGANGDRWTDALVVELASTGSAPPVELHLRRGCALVVDGEGLEPCWIDIRDDGGRCLSALLDRNLYTGAFGRACRTSAWSYYLPRGNYDVRAVGAERVLTTARVALIEGETRECKLR